MRVESTEKIEKVVLKQPNGNPTASKKSVEFYILFMCYVTFRHRQGCNFVLYSANDSRITIAIITP